MFNFDHSLIKKFQCSTHTLLYIVHALECGVRFPILLYWERNHFKNETTSKYTDPPALVSSTFILCPSPPQHRILRPILRRPPPSLCQPPPLTIMHHLHIHLHFLPLLHPPKPGLHAKLHLLQTTTSSEVLISSGWEFRDPECAVHRENPRLHA